MDKVKPVIFMHVATLHNYQEIIDDVITRLLDSGLINDINFINFNVVGDRDINLNKLPYIYHNKVIITKNGTLLDYELSTIQLISDYIHDTTHNIPILYLQTLSVSPYNYKIPGYKDRRELYFYFAINKYKKCLKVLNSYDVCGCNWNKDMTLFKRYPPHFSGNIWWSNSEYLKTLPNFEWLIDKKNYILDFRHQAEFWIGMNKNVNHKSLYTWDYTNLDGGQRINKNYMTSNE